MEETKYCRFCYQDKPLSEFNANKKEKDGKQRACKDCHKRWHRERTERDPEWRRRNKLRKLYSMSLEEYEDLLSQQGNRCAICGEDSPRTLSGVFHVDHDHKTGKVRALLCATCNTGLGCFYDNPALLTKAAQYVTSYATGALKH